MPTPTHPVLVETVADYEVGDFRAARARLEGAPPSSELSGDDAEARRRLETALGLDRAILGTAAVCAILWFVLFSTYAL
jgi:hypothetical protein